MHSLDQSLEPVSLAPAFRKRLWAAMRIPAIERLFPAPWTAAARRVLPSPSPQFTATAMWGPVLGWCVLELLAESIDPQNPEHVALDLFDRLRLREPFAMAFADLGFEGEEGWRVAARIKVLLLTGAGVGKAEDALVESEASVAADALGAIGEERVTLFPDLWLDPDVRWLTGVHEAQGHAYVVRESYEELLWWLLMPSLLRVAGEAVPSRVAVERMSRTVEEAIATAEAAGYRIDELLGTPAEADSGEIEEVVGQPASAEIFGEVMEELPPPVLDCEPPHSPHRRQETSAQPKEPKK
jgi:hypothetical protein